MRDMIFLPGAVLVFVTACGCAPQPEHAILPGITPAITAVVGTPAESLTEETTTQQAKNNRNWPPAHLALQPGDFDDSAKDPVVKDGRLTLADALRLTLLHNPELGVAFLEMRSAEARRLQASLRPNPEMEMEMERIDDTAPGGGGMRAVETTVALGQVLELGDKRARRMRVASLQRDLTAWDYEVMRLEILTRTTHAFLDVLAARKQLVLAARMLDLGRKSADAVARRVEAGKVPPLEKRKALVFLAGRKIAFRRARGELQTAQNRLAVLLGLDQPRFDDVAGDLDRITVIPPFKVFIASLKNNPGLKRWRAELARRRAALALEKANRIPDLRVSGGFSHENETNEHSYVLGLSVPLPIFDRNQGAIAEAENEVEKGKAEELAHRKRARLELAEAYQALHTACMETRSLRENVLPQATEALEAAQTGFEQGRFGYLEVLDTQRTLVEVKGQLIQAQVAYHHAVAEIERITGTSLQEMIDLTENSKETDK